MKFSKALVCGIATLALSGSLALVGCSSDTSSTDTSSDDTATEEEATDDEAEEAAYDVEGEWIYYTEIVTESVYGDVTSEVEAFVIELADGSATLTPDSDNGGAYSSDSGTYEVSGETVTITFDTYGTVTGTLVDDDEMEIDAGTFSSDDTETYSFLLY